MIEFYIVGGYIKLDKKVFVQEMLSKDSRLRILLNYKAATDFASIHPTISQPDENNVLTIDFCNGTYACLGETPKELLAALKLKYGGKLRGKVACRGEYSMFGGIFSFEIDLDSDSKDVLFSNM